MSYHPPGVQPPQADEEQEDVCRVCRSGREDGQLFYPCQCTGSIRYVHEDCLSEWLKRSRKDNCELCDTPLEFTKVFTPNMPTIVPLPILFKHSILSVLSACFFVLRAITVALAWLAILPYFSLWIFRFYLWSAHAVGTFFRLVLVSSSHPSNSITSASSVANGSVSEILKNVTSPLEDLGGDKSEYAKAIQLALEEAAKNATEVMINITKNPIGNLTAWSDYQRGLRIMRGEGEGEKVLWRRLAKTLAKDTFTGQIITSVVVVLFVLLFLLREFVVINGPIPPNPEEVPVDDATLFAHAPRVIHIQEGGGEEEVTFRTWDNPHVLPPTQAQTQTQTQEGRRVPDNWEEVVDNEGVERRNVLEEGQKRKGKKPQWRRAYEFEYPEEDEEGDEDYVDEDGEEDDDESTSEEDEQEGEDTGFTVGLPLSPGTNERFQEDDRERRRRMGKRRAEDVTPTNFRQGEDSAETDEEAKRRRRGTRFASPFPSESATHSTSLEGFHWDDFNSPPPLIPPTSSSPSSQVQPPPPVYSLNNPPPPPPLEHTPTTREILLNLVDQANQRVAAAEGAGGDEIAAQVQGGALLVDLQPPAQVLVQPPPGAPNGEVDQDGLPVEEGFEGDMLDDLEGILEAIGMRGSLLVLVQNMGLMNLLMAICLGAALWIPLTVGKVLAAGNAIRLVALPLRAVRILSDPIFDFAFTIISWAPKHVLRILGPKVAALCRFLPASATRACSTLSEVATGNVTESLAQNVTTILTTPNSALPLPPTLSFPLTSPATLIKLALGSIVRHWHQMAFVDDALHRALCVALGYSSIFLGGIWYLQSSKNAYSQSVSRAIAEGIKQQLILLKVAIFVFVEIIIFPTTCGILLNLATLPLFPNATVSTRIAFYRNSPVSGLFLTWLSGTIHMFVFACGIDGIRDVVRKGTMWFIKDPSADFHPIRDILERKSLTQARKIFISAVLYGASLFLSVGVNVLFLRYAVRVLPLRWVNERAFSLPVDLLFFRFMVPVAIRYTDPRTRFSKLFVSWAKFTAHELRLTNFIFGGERDPTEEGTHVRKTWKARLTLKKADSTDTESDMHGASQLSLKEVEFRKDGSFARVPAVDNIRIAPGRRVILPVSEQGHPFKEADALIIASQVHEMESSRQHDKYCVVYLPPHFKLRVALFIYLLWFTGSLAGMSMAVGPLLLGRYLFTFVTPKPVHDLYSLGIGIYIVTCVTLGIRRISSIRDLRPTSYHIRLVANLLFASIGVGACLPTLAALLINSFVFTPLSWYRPAVNMHTINIPQEWATGTIVLNIAWHLATFFPDGPLKTSFLDVRRSFDDDDLLTVLINLNRFSWPLIFPSIALVSAPGIVAWFAWQLVLTNAAWWTIMQGDDAAPVMYGQVCRVVYGLTAIVLFSKLASHRLEAYKATWLAKLREQEYLLERKLKNFTGEMKEGGTNTTVTNPQLPALL